MQPIQFISWLAKRILLVLLSVISLFYGFAATKTWTGGANDGKWSNAGNWNNNILPQAADDIVLDNSIQAGSYIVTLPDIPVTIKTISIRPVSGQTIEFILPATNLNTATGTGSTVAGLTVTGPGYGIVIEAGGILLNASNASSGDNLVFADSIRINNGGRYIHHTRASHANNIVRLLSSAPGTELGIFEFDVPTTASYTVSISNRVYGSLVFSATAAMGTKTYACNGSNELTINGQLQINPGVNFNVNLGGIKGNVLIKKDLIQNGGMFNIASGAGNSTVVYIGGTLQQAAGSQITETNTGLPTLEFNGNSIQHISVLGTIANSINFRINNNAGVLLDAPLLLPYRLQLSRGKIKTTADKLLTLATGCGIIADSLSATSYVDGPICKQNILAAPSFLFPVGKDPELRWMELKNVTGTYTVEFIREDPRKISNSYGAGIDHISTGEYWKIVADANTMPVSNVELSFNTPSSGGVTDLSSLRVAALTGNTWINAGQIGVSGSAGASGSVTSAPVFNFGSPAGYFALASNTPTENPLPVQLESFTVIVEHQIAILKWAIGMPGDADHFEIDKSIDGKNFLQIGEVTASPYQTEYEFNQKTIEPGTVYFQIRIIEKTGRSLSSRIVRVDTENNGWSIHVNPTIIQSGTANLKVSAPEATKLNITISSSNGITVRRFQWSVIAGENMVSLNLSGLANGIYQLVAWDDKKRLLITRFIK